MNRTTAARSTASTTSAMSMADLAAAVTVVVIWGLNFVAMKLALREFTPMQLGATRYAFAAMPLLLMIRRPALPLRWVAAYGLLQGLGQFGLLFMALRLGMTAGLASVLMQTQVFFTALMAFAFLGERLSRPMLGGLIFALAGLACFGIEVVAGRGTSADVTLAGLLLTIGAAGMWGASNILARHLQRHYPDYNPIQFVVWSSLAPVLPFLLLTWLVDGAGAQHQWMDASISAWAGAAYLGWFATVMAYGLWTGLLKRHPANQVAPFGLLVPVVGLLAGMLLLNESLSGWQLAGTAWIAAALVIILIAARGR